MSRWLDLELKNPIIFASLTFFSSVRSDEHIEYFGKIIKNGVGAIVLPSVDPLKKGDKDFNATKAESIMLQSGLKKNDFLGFSLSAPTDPNIISKDYGLNLFKKAKKSYKAFPFIPSVIVRDSSNEELEKTLNFIKDLVKNGAEALELNYSCPNVITSDRPKLDAGLLQVMSQEWGIPVSIKISPQLNYDDFLLKN